MISTHTFPRRCINILIYVVVSVLVLAAILLSLARLLLPTVEDFKPDVESWVSELVGQQIQIASLDAAWYGFEPQLVLKGVQLLSEDRMETYGYFQQARLGLNIFASAFEGRFVPGAFTIDGARFVVLRHKDNHVSIQGISGDKSSADDQTDMLKDWFFKQRVLDVKNSEIVWRDLKSESHSWVFSNVNLRFRNDADRHVITGAVNLPEALGAKLKIAVDAQGDLLSGDGWFGNAYIEGDGLRLKEWGENFSFQNVNISNGTAGFRLWTQWRKAHLNSAQGSLVVNNLHAVAKNAASIRVIDSLTTVFSAQKHNEVWEAALDKLKITSKSRAWPETRMDAKFLASFDKIEAELTYLDLNEVLPIVAFLNNGNTELNKNLERYKPKGIITDLGFQINRVDGKLEFYSKGVFSHLQNSAFNKAPGVDGLDGKFVITNNFAKITMPKQALVFNYPAAYKEKALIDNFKATLYASFSEHKLEITGADIALDFAQAGAEGSFYFLSDKSRQSPLLDLAFYFDSGKVASAELYTPSKLLSPNVMHWLDQSLLGGHVNNGGLMFYGNLASFPFKESEGVFNVNLNIEDGKLSFAKSWPLIEQVNGVFDLRSYGFWFYGESGESINSALSNVVVNMPNFFDTKKMLFINGMIDGDSRFKSQYLHQSPLEDMFAKHITPLSLEGPSNLELNLAIPLSDVRQTRATGLLSVKNNHLFSDDWGLDIENLNADLSFSNESVAANNVSGYMGPVVIEGGQILTVGKETGSHLQISYSGDVDAEGVRHTLGEFLDKSHWGKFLNGMTSLDFVLDIPLYSSADVQASRISLSLNSKLQNMAVDLPAPFGKSAGEEQDFSLFAELSGKNRALKIQYGNTYSNFEFSGLGSQHRINRGAVSFSGPVELPSEFGFRYTGNINAFSWTAWEPVIFPPANERSLFEPDGGGSSVSHYFDVSFNKLELLGIKYNNTKIQASSSAQQWAVHFDGPEVSGKMFIPLMTEQIPIRIKLDRLYVNREQSEGEDDYLDPRGMPALDLSITDFKYNEIAFGELSMIASKIDAGLFLEKFQVKNPDMLIEAKGNWTEISDKQQSEFSIKLNAKDLGKALNSWGYADAVDGGNGAIDIKAGWEGKPSDFDIKIVDGNAHVALKDISLLTFDIGAAKMFGLLLPRRLLLDFRDVFKEGMHFDNISGKYKIENGDAFTSGLTLKGPLADIELAGKVGLVAQDYDQVVTINRHLVSDSLPIVAALAAATPVLGAQVYVVKKLFESQIDDILSVQYTLSGTWAEPIIKKVSADSASDSTN